MLPHRFGFFSYPVRFRKDRKLHRLYPSEQTLFMETKDDIVNQHGIASLTSEQLQEIDLRAIVGKRAHQFGVEAMLKRDLVPNSIKLEK